MATHGCSGETTSLRPPGMGATRVSGSSSGACGRGAGERPSTPASPATLAASLASTVGKRGLVLGESIGSGAYAKVKSAHYSNAPERRLAVKIVSRKRAPAGYMDKFLPREIKALRRLSHPHVIGFVDTFASLDNTYIVMEHAARGDLLEYINAHGRFPEPGARRLFMQLASAVGYCHSMRVVHRDLKCENILLDHNLNLKLSDFGFAALLHPQEQHLHTHCGSYAYAAPEILNAEDYKGTQTDVWSMGVVLFAMLCGKLPFCDKDFKTLLVQVKTRIKISRSVSRDGQSMLRALLAYDPNKRMRVTEVWDHGWIRPSLANSWAAELRHLGGVDIDQQRQPPPLPLLTSHTAGSEPAAADGSAASSVGESAASGACAPTPATAAAAAPAGATAISSAVRSSSMAKRKPFQRRRTFAMVLPPGSGSGGRCAASEAASTYAAMRTLPVWQESSGSPVGSSNGAVEGSSGGPPLKFPPVDQGSGSSSSSGGGGGGGGKGPMMAHPYPTTRTIFQKTMDSLRQGRAAAGSERSHPATFR